MTNNIKQNDVHRHQINSRTMEIKFFGMFMGLKYGAVLDLKNGHVKWDDTIEFRTPRTSSETTATKKASDCPECTKGIMRLIRGGMGWAKEALGLDQVPDVVAATRQSICETCPTNCYDFGVCREDWPDRPPDKQGCGCILALKVTQASEECPHKHWLKHDG